MYKFGRGLTLALCGVGIALTLSAKPAAAQGVVNQSEQDYVGLDHAFTPAKGHPNLMGLIGYTDAGDGGLALGARYSMPLAERLSLEAGASAAFVGDTAWGLQGGLKYQLGNFGMQKFSHAILGYIGYSDTYGDGAFGGTFKWASTYALSRDSFSGNLGITVSDGVEPAYPIGLGWSHRFSEKWRGALEWSGAIAGGDLYSSIGPAVWYTLPNTAGSVTSIGLGAQFGVGESDGWGVNLMGQWHP